MNASLIEGLNKLGHCCYGLGQNANNFLIPHTEQDFDVFIQCMPGEVPRIAAVKNIPKVFLWGEDGGPFTAAQMAWMLSYDACFVRDLTGPSPNNMFPMNFGIEERYYCATKDKPVKPLTERSIDVLFLGRMGYGNRDKYINAIQAEFSEYNLMLDGHRFSQPDPYWQQWLNVHCCHDPRYYEALADAKIILSLKGAGPDCARTWEALASGGILMLEYAPTRGCPQELQSGTDCLMFKSEDVLVEKIRSVLQNPGEYQAIADQGMYNGSRWHTTIGRAKYFLECLESLNLLKNP